MPFVRIERNPSEYVVVQVGGNTYYVHKHHVCYVQALLSGLSYRVAAKEGV